MALMLLPFLWAVVHQTGLMIPNLISEGYRSWWLYGAGALVYLLGERLLTKPMGIYVFGHELTHALTGILSGARIHSFKAKSTGGEVRLSKSNAFIALSPYIVPLYGLALILVYLIVRSWWNFQHLKSAFEVGLGFALAFHVSLTIHALHKHQSDLKVMGFFLSGVLILLGNLLIFSAFGVSLFSKTPLLTDYCSSLMRDTRFAWKTTLDFGWRGSKKIYAFIEEKPWTR